MFEGPTKFGDYIKLPTVTRLPIISAAITLGGGNTGKSDSYLSSPTRDNFTGESLPIFFMGASCYLIC